ncbi:MAG: TonB-dependent receptor plug domain-containing protein [Bacteroidia bacterium]|nr:TonB-dependent receptor plug domain-containing protein [Bacteroidia bacterium]
MKNKTNSHIFLLAIQAFLLIYCNIRLSFSQQTLPEVEIFSNANLIPGFQLQPDTLRQSIFRFGNFSEWLTKESFLMIRSYGNGMISSISSAGGNASQFQLAYNGIPINNLMLGQTDANIIPSSAIQSYQIQSGQNSISFGSGATGGFLNLNTLHTNDTSRHIEIGVQYESLKNTNFFLNVKYKKLSMLINNLSGENVYRYQNQENKFILSRQPIQQHFANLQYSFTYKNHRFHFDIPAFYGKRHPGYFVKGIFEKQQTLTDFWMNAALHHNFNGSGFNVENKFYYQPNALHFEDTIARINSRNFIHRGGSIHYFTLPRKKIILKSRAESHLSQILTSNYKNQKQRFDYFNFSQNAVFPVLNRLLSIQAALRLDYYVHSRRAPLTYFMSLNGKFFRFSDYYIKYSTAFRHPTCNELFWNPGGNPDLLPEQSRGWEAGGSTNFKLGHSMLIKTSGEIFYRLTQNMIVWTPGPNGNPTPINLQYVLSRGAFCHSELHYLSKKFFINLHTTTAYVLSTLQKIRSNDSELLKGRQIIYTPRYRFNHSLSLGNTFLSLILWHHYTGYRFTTSDNSEWLPPYHLWDAGIQIKPKFKPKNRIVLLSLNFTVKNITNQAYQIMRGYPMPGRYYQCGITIKQT